MKRASVLKVVGLGMAFGLAFASGRLTAKEESHNVYELRRYTTHDGKLGDLNKRFREHTNKLFVKHGMTLIGYWTPMDEPESENTLIYILSHKSRDAAEKSFAAFRSDPDWIAAKTKSEEAGPIVKKVESTFMEPTDYSPLK